VSLIRAGFTMRSYRRREVRRDAVSLDRARELSSFGGALADSWSPTCPRSQQEAARRRRPPLPGATGPVPRLLSW